SSSRPFSSKATRDSSFSTLTMSLLPVFREERPKIFLTLSIIKVKKLIGHSAKRPIHAAVLILTERSSCWWAPASRLRLNRYRRRSRMPSKKPLKEITRRGGCCLNRPGHWRGTSPPDLSLGVGVRFDVGRRVRTRHLCRGTL